MIFDFDEKTFMNMCFIKKNIFIDSIVKILFRELSEISLNFIENSEFMKKVQY